MSTSTIEQRSLHGKVREQLREQYLEPAGGALPSLREPPTSGVEVGRVEKLGERHGLHLNDIVVAVDGMRVHNLAQYFSAKSASIDPVMRFVVWRDLKYIETAGPLRYGGLWGEVKNYVPGTKPPAPKPRRW